MHNETRFISDEAGEGRCKEELKRELLPGAGDDLLLIPGGAGVSIPGEARRTKRDRHIHLKTSCDAAYSSTSMNSG
jgi:hypothetical protein